MIDKRYSPKDIEKKWYDFWIEQKLFNPKDKGDAFSVIVPPPNVTGVLHIGHVLNTSIQDSVVRYKRMKGFSTLWVPGIDHAGIATQQKVEEKLRKESKDISKISKEEFLKEAWKWKDEHGEIIFDQFKKLGLSLDWDRTMFTLDEPAKKAVKKAFVDLYNDGLIYRGEYIVNWSVDLNTAISDDEVEHRELDRPIWDISYPLVDGGYITVSTTRPETIPADTAIAVNPEDQRYKKLIGKKVIVPFVNREIEIIADDYVKKDFGTGALKVTPAHAKEDFEIGKRHNLKVINMFDKHFKINKLCEKYEGLTIKDARREMVGELKSLGLLKKEWKVISNVGHCSRSKGVVEPVVSKQWFVKMKPLAKRAIEVVKSGEIEIKPEHWKKTYFYWLENIEDWCISRQLWWGHEIPVSYDKDGNIHLDKRGEGLIEEEDVLDTWFSSWLWPFVVMGWPDKRDDMERYFPTDVVVTGADIIFFWVARMIMASLYFVDSVPFKKVLFHGIVRDDKGRKMSKSLGNSPDTLALIDKYGSDALRFALLYNNTIGMDMNYSEYWVEQGRNFCNKIWNTYRFLSMNDSKYVQGMAVEAKDSADRWILHLLSELIKDVDSNLDSYNLDVALKKIYNFFWGEFCDWYIEISKYREFDSENKILISMFVLENCLKLLHPFIPFITEEIWSNISSSKDSISIESFPDFEFNNVETFNLVKDIVRAVRNVRAEMNIAPKQPLDIEAKLLKGSLSEDKLKFIRKVANLSSLNLVASLKDRQNSAIKVSDETKICVKLDGAIDSEKEILRLEKVIQKEMKELERVSRKLESKSFLDRAPEAVVEREERIKREQEEKISLIKDKIYLLKKDV